jgi:dTDP-glucose 4,6-dehydratase
MWCRLHRKQFRARLVAASHELVLNLDKFTYSGNLENLANLQGDARHVLVLSDCFLVDRLLVQYKSLPLVEHNPAEGMRTNVLGTWNTAKQALAPWSE